MNKFLEKILGITKIREEANEATQEAIRIAEDARNAAQEAVEETRKATEAEQLAKMAPKDRATANNEPWVGVVETHINKENVRNGFFELDWNDAFVEQLINAGYGLKNDNPEDVVDRWFRELCAGVVVEDGYDTFNINAGSLNGANINKSK